MKKSYYMQPADFEKLGMTVLLLKKPNTLVNDMLVCAKTMCYDSITALESEEWFRDLKETSGLLILHAMPTEAVKSQLLEADRKFIVDSPADADQILFRMANFVPEEAQPSLPDEAPPESPHTSEITLNFGSKVLFKVKWDPEILSEIEVFHKTHVDAIIKEMIISELTKQLPAIVKQLNLPVSHA